jgi:WD40 repeat protein
VAVNASRSLIAVGEKGNHPNIYVYSYPALQIVKILHKGTERSYAALAFDASGEKLASLGGAPDYLLTVWDWEREAIVLHAKAFGQDIFTVSFSPDNPGKLVTSGTGHIRFWKMASTFTGLKLQGDIGKFGKVELSDVEAFAILPDGKVLSSTESGALLLWEGNFIKLRVVRKNGRPCHVGPIYVVLLERQEGYFVTAGQDGYIRWWDLPTLDTVEIDSDRSLDFELEPVQEAYVGDGVVVRHMCRWRDPQDPAKDKYAIQDLNGGLWSFDLASQRAVQLLNVPGGGLVGLDVSPGNHFAATAGVDGTVRCWDYVARRQLYHHKFDSPASMLRWAPASVCTKTRTLITGFQDGTLRLMYRLPEGWKRLATLKPHAGPITAIEYSPTGHLLATGGKDATIFLFHVPTAGSIDGVYEPIGFVAVSAPVTSICWREDGLAFLYTLLDGTVGEADLSGDGVLAADVSKSYQITLPLRTYAFRRRPAMKKKASAGGEGDKAGDAASETTQQQPQQPPAEQVPEAPVEETPAHFSALQVSCEPEHRARRDSHCVPYMLDANRSS